MSLRGGRLEKQLHALDECMCIVFVCVCVCVCVIQVPSVCTFCMCVCMWACVSVEGNPLERPRPRRRVSSCLYNT